MAHLSYKIKLVPYLRASFFEHLIGRVCFNQWHQRWTLAFGIAKQMSREAPQVYGSY